MDKNLADLLSPFVVEIRLWEPTYQTPMSLELFQKYVASGLPVETDAYGTPVLVVYVPEWGEWSSVPVVSTDVCCCNHESETCRFEQDVPLMEDVRFEKIEHGCTMCSDCVESWNCDWEIRLPEGMRGMFDLPNMPELGN